MSLFASARERRLWIWTACVVLAIYSTLALARTLAGLLPESTFGAAFFILGMVLVLAAVVTQGLRVRPRGAEIGVALGVAVAYMMVFVRMGIPTERSHIIEYGVVALFMHEAFLERARCGRRVRFPALSAVLGASVVGAIDEGIQRVLPNRVFDPQDILFNVLAAALAVTASVSLRWARRFAERRR